MTDILSTRQRQIITLMSRGYTRKEIAERMQISIFTLDEYCKTIREKLNVTTMFEALTILIEDKVRME